ncbi:MAG: hypothetical protein L6Q38_02470 [Nitrospira sp.]|nr:hypothetical protein [Planctomycetota bacterium]MCK6498325.1 hypothetical protein [Nitrospira sp.]
MIETLTKTSMGLLFLASVPVGGDPSLWANWGLAGMVVGYTLYRDWQREKRMSEAIERHEEWVRGTLVGALERNSVAMERVVERLDKDAKAT